MSDLLNTDSGRLALRRAVCWLTHRRMSKWFKRSWYREFFRWWKTTDKSWSWQDVLGDLNTEHDTEVLQMQNIMGQLGCLSESVDNEIIWVDPLNGSDTEGDGSVSHPWASLWFINALPEKINHNYRILILNDLVVNDDIHLNLNFGPNGSLAILGVGQPTVVSGPYTLTLCQDEDGVSDSTLEMQVAAAGWANDQHWGTWLQWLTGASSNLSAQPVHKSFSDRIVTLPYFTGAVPAPGSTFQMIRPTVKLSCHTLSINANGPLQHDLAPDPIGASRVVIGNIEIDISGSTTAQRDHISFSGNCHFSAPFTRITFDENQTGPYFLLNCTSFNRYEAFDTYIDLLAQTAIPNFDPHTQGMVNNPSLCATLLYHTGAVYANKQWLSLNLIDGFMWTDVRGWIGNGGARTFARYFYCGVLTNSGTLVANFFAMDGIDGEWCLQQQLGDAKLTRVHFSGMIPGGAAPSAGILMQSGILLINFLTAPAVSPFTHVGTDFDGMGTVHFETDPAALTGTNGDIDFTIPGISAYPALVSTTVNDGNGNYVGWINM